MKYYLYYLTVSKKQTIEYRLKQIFYSKDELIYFLHYHQGRNARNGITYDNKYLDDINMTGKDVTHDYWDENHDYYYLRPYLFQDDNGRTIDVRQWKNEILPSSHPTWITYEWRMRWCNKNKKRQHRRQHKNYSWRHPHYKHLIEDSLNNEYKDYIRKKPVQNNRSIDFYELRQHKSCCWKDQTRKKHQWE